MKKKGFTLVELIISMALLSFIIMMSSLLFDHAIQASPTLGKVITNNSKSYSEVENMIFNVRKNASSFPTYTEFVNLDIKVGGVEIKNVKGHLISYDGTKVQLDTGVSIDDQLFTFVGNGHKETPTVKMKNSLLKNESVAERFKFFPLSASSISVSYKHESETGDNLKKIRSRTLRATVASNSGEFLHAPYVDAVEIPNALGKTLLYGGLYSPNDSGFEYIGEAADGPEKANVFDGSFEIKGYTDSKEQYFNSTDKTFAVGAFTLNRNGHSGNMINSLANKIQSEQNAVHLIGLPYISKLIGFYDYNLLIAPSKTKANAYYSLYNLEAVKDTDYVYGSANAVVSEVGEAYTIDWGKRDVRNILKLSTNEPKLLVSKGAVHGAKLDLVLEGTNVQMDYIGAQKSYGASAYYNDYVSNFEAELNKDYTFFTKFNIENYSELVLKKKETAPIAIFYHNWNLSNGTPSAGGGFIVFADKDGELYLNTGSEPKKLNFNIKKDAKLYKDSSGDAKFEQLQYEGSPVNSKRDGREQFLIFSFDVKRSNRETVVKMKTLKSKTVSGSAPITEVHKFDDIKVSTSSSEKKFFFGGVPKRGNIGSGLVNLDDPLGGKGAIEVSDLLLYEENLSAKKIGSADFNSLTMEYLYRKYLTDKERKKNGYDQYFINKY